MSTNSMIGIAIDDTTARTIYCHYDGYIENNGELLYKYYKTADKVNALINLGNLSYLDKKIGTKTNFNIPEPGQCLFYGRDRGERGQGPKPMNIDTLRKYYSYNYLFMNNRWYVSCEDTNWVFEPLGDVLAAMDANEDYAYTYEEDVDPNVSGGMNPSQQEIEDFFTGASTEFPRKFRVDASTKIQGGPVDFSKFDDTPTFGPGEVTQLFDDHASELINYAKSKFEPITNQLNQDLKTIVEKYVVDLDAFNESFGFRSTGDEYTRVPSGVIDGIDFLAVDYGSLWCEVAPSDGEEFLDYAGFWAGGPRGGGEFSDSEFELVPYGFYIDNDMPEVINPDYKPFINAWSYLFSRKFVLKQLTLDDVIPTYKALVDAFAAWVDKTYSEYIEATVTVYRDNY